MPLSPLTSRVPRLAAFALAIVLAGCARPEAGGNAGPTGGTLVIVATGDADVLFPPSGAVTTSADVAGLVFSRLADLTFDLNTVDDAGFTPELARSWDHADSTTLVFHLDPRARWHDGGDLFKLQRILGHKSVTMTQRYAHLAPEAFAADHGRLGDQDALVEGVVVQFSANH